MKAHITAAGVLVVQAEDKTEEYALRQWVRESAVSRTLNGAQMCVLPLHNGVSLDGIARGAIFNEGANVG